MDEYSLTFLPFLKRQPALDFKSGELGHLSASFDLTVKDDAGIEHNIKSSAITLRGPGDILGISQNMIARLEPPAQTHDFEPNYFPYVEFVDADFCWRYSLDTLKASSRTAFPWLTLIVLNTKEMEGMTNDGIEVLSLFEDRRQFLSVLGQYLPNLADTSMTAHVHLNNHQYPIADFIENQPAQHCSRLFCFRRLTPETNYMAFLVPTYKIGIQAAFGLAQQDAGNEKAWMNPDADEIIKLPVYFSWSFSTSESGDFEQLARNLKPTAIAEEDQVGTRVVDANLMTPITTTTDPQFDRFFLREGALAAPDFSSRRQQYTEHSKSLPLTKSLLSTLNKSLKSSADEILDDDIDPLITLPVYGRYFQKTAEIIAPENDQWPDSTPWIHELNLDFRHRVAASFGTMAVQNNQDEYMQACWSQIGEIRKANEKLRLTKAAFLISKVIERKHLEPLSDERFALISTPFHGYFTAAVQGASVSIKQEFAESGISPGVYSATFRRVANRQIGIKQVKPVQAIIAQTKISVHPRSLQVRTHSIPTAPKILSGVLSKLPGADTQYLAPKKVVIPFKDVVISNRFRVNFNIEKVLKNKILGSIKTSGHHTLPENFDPIMDFPKIDTPMYAALNKLSNDYLLPGIENIANNGVTLCEENRRFIEAYMVGLNHEMGRELIWRNYPTDQRGTIFSYFWDQVQSQNPPADIKEIHKWTNILGDNKPGLQTKNLVLIIKGDIIRRYPGTNVYVVKTGRKGQYWTDEYPKNDPPMDAPYKIDPVLRAQVGSDILCVGFSLSLEAIHGPKRDGEYYFILQENQDLPRFGLDVASKQIKDSHECTGQPLDLNELSWSNVTLDNAGYLTTFEQKPFTDIGSGSATSATIAKKTYQLPIRVAIHASELLEESEST